MPRTPWLVTAGCIVLAHVGWAGALEVLSPAPIAAPSGAYVTLAFGLEGTGTYDFEVGVPSPWTPLAASGTVTVDGTGFVSVTLRVPATVPAGAKALVEVAFSARNGLTDDGRGSVLVEALPRAALSLTAPTELGGLLDTALAFDLLVRNAGNVSDRIALSATAAMWAPRFAVDELELQPGEERSVAVVLHPLGQVTSGYRTLVRIEARSGRDPEVSATAFVAAVFTRDPKTSASADPDPPPTLTLEVAGTLLGSLVIDEEGTAARFGYAVRPSLAGDLSDYVRVSAEADNFAGTDVEPFAELPTGATVAFAGEGWDAAGTFAPGRYGVSGGATFGDWRMGAGTAVTVDEGPWAVRANAFAASQREDLDLQFAARVEGDGETRRDAVGGRYRTGLAEGVTLSVGADLLGTADDAGYDVEPVLQESVTWQSQAFDVTQSYTGAPFSSLHTFGLSGGTRALAPVGVRAATSLTLSADDLRWRSALTLTTRPAPGFGVTLTGSFDQAAPATSWTLRPAVSYRVGGEGWSAGAGASYGYTAYLRGEATSRRAYQVSGSGTWRDLSVASAASWVRTTFVEGSLAEQRLVVDVGARYRIGTDTALRAAVAYEHEIGPDDPSPRTELQIGAAWDQRWSASFGTGLAYDWTVREHVGRIDRTERLALAATFRDVGLDGLTLGAGYAVSSTHGLLTGIAPLRHELGVRLGYTLRTPFATPAGLVELFGGRRGGGVAGVVFLDRDLDGVRGDDEPPLTGIEVRIGGRQVVSGTGGTYSLRVAAGAQSVGYGAGRPPGIAARGPSVVWVIEGAEHRIDLPFVPVTTASVTLFDDLDGDGAQGAQEPGIAFGGVVFDGPELRRVRLDGRGNGTVLDLVPGRYVVAPDPERLPERYAATTTDVVIDAEEAMRPVHVTLGAGAPVRRVVTTFVGGDLALFGHAEPQQAAPGADVRFQALVSTSVDRVTLTLDGRRTPMRHEGGRWVAVVRLPRGLPLGSLTVDIVAEDAEREAETSVEVGVVDRPLVIVPEVMANVGEVAPLRVDTAFAAQAVVLDMSGVVVVLESVDGYGWRGSWLVDEALVDFAQADPDRGVAGAAVGRVIADGEELASLIVEVRAEE